LKLKDFKYSYNIFQKIYRVELFEHGKWRKCTYDKKNFEFLIANNLKTKNEIRNFPYKPYFLYRIKWSFINLWKWIIKADTKAQKFVKSGFVIIITYFLGFITNCNFFNSHNTDQKETQEIIDTNHKLKYFQTFSDSLLTEIKQKEAIIKEFEQAQKDSTSKTQSD
tara:strand:- start:4861 stop:5358 length:498 start_codon:yes stop_codon:yes gene_type:complete